MYNIITLLKSEPMDNCSRQRSSSEDRHLSVLYPSIKTKSFKSEKFQYTKKVEAPSSETQVSPKVQQLLNEIEKKNKKNAFLFQQWKKASMEITEAEKRQQKAIQAKDWEQIAIYEDIIKEKRQYIYKIIDCRKQLRRQISELQKELDALRKDNNDLH